MFHRLAAEMIGTFWLVFGGCGSAVFAAKFLSGGVSLGIGFLGVALAFEGKVSIPVSLSRWLEPFRVRTWRS